MNTEQLQTFLTLADTKNFSRAAERLIVSQSTVSKRIQELERETGQQLFTRDRTGIRITRAGNALLEYAQQIISLEARAHEQMSRTSQFAYYLMIGSAYAYSDVYLTEQLQSFIAHHPDTSVRIKSGHTSALLADLRQAKIDIAFVHHPFSHPEFTCEEVRQDHVLLVTDIDNQTHAKGIMHSDIRSLPMIHSNFLYATTHNWLFPRNQHFQLEMDVASDVLPLLRNSHWYAFLPCQLVKPLLDRKELRIIPILDGEVPPVHYYMIYRKDNHNQQAMMNWILHLRDSQQHA